MERYNMWLFRTEVDGMRRSVGLPAVQRYEVLNSEGSIGTMLEFALEADRKAARQLHERDVLLTKVKDLSVGA